MVNDSITHLQCVHETWTVQCFLSKLAARRNTAWDNLWPTTQCEHETRTCALFSLKRRDKNTVGWFLRVAYQSAPLEELLESYQSCHCSWERGHCLSQENRAGSTLVCKLSAAAREDLLSGTETCEHRHCVCQT